VGGAGFFGGLGLLWDKVSSTVGVSLELLDSASGMEGLKW
jgi:hypothetical protein